MSALFEFCVFEFLFWLYWLAKNLTQRYVTINNAANFKHCNFYVAAAVILATAVGSFLLRSTE